MLGMRLKITAYERRHRSALLDLAWYSQWAHKYLDWHKTSQWLDSELGSVLLAWHSDQLVGYVGISLPVDGWSWIRLLGIRDGKMPGLVLRELLEAAEGCCGALGVCNLVILMITNWLPAYLRELGFQADEDIITMRHIGIPLPPKPKVNARIRPAEAQDIDGMTAIDRLAFDPPWQLTKDDMRQAYRIAASATVAERDDELIAYQLGTRQDEIGHLARLAVHPAHRRKQVASALIHQLVADFHRRNLTELSVNTQKSNLPSQRLYERYGFYRNGNDIALWRKQLN
jgi:ribosomal-protein-alanine N-acetyltransferase